ncbi:MAG TPA: hypothetical protein ENN54_06825 [Thermoplasmatales archaeon]|nr:hypothetical protein [Thermoplasmatales archaeon]
MGFDKKTYVIPEGTTFDGDTIRVNGDVVLSNDCQMVFNVEAQRLFAGERTTIEGDVQTDGDVRIDLFSTVEGNIACGGDACIGEGTKILGRLSLKGDLDVGDNVEIRDGFTARGWINIRSPIPMVLYVLLYLLELIKRGHSEEVDRILQELQRHDQVIAVAERYLFLPQGSSVGREAVINGSLQVGADCTVTGNHTVKGNVYVAPGSAVHGSIKATGTVVIDDQVTVTGNVEGQAVTVGLATVGGDVSAKKVSLFKNADISGTVNATEGVQFFDEKKKKMAAKVQRFRENVDVVDEVAEML